MRPEIGDRCCPYRGRATAQARRAMLMEIPNNPGRVPLYGYRVHVDYQRDLYGQWMLPRDLTFDHDRPDNYQPYQGKIVLVTGGRKFVDPATIGKALKTLAPALLIGGGADGLDLKAKQWAFVDGVHFAEVRALWEEHGLAAGPIRNGMMLKLRPDFVLAFPGGSGTKNMVNQALAASVPVLRVPEYRAPRTAVTPYLS